MTSIQFYGVTKDGTLPFVGLQEKYTIVPLFTDEKEARAFIEEIGGGQLIAAVLSVPEEAVANIRSKPALTKKEHDELNS